MIEQVVEGGYCIGCGSCVAYDNKNSIVENKFGLYEAKLTLVDDQASGSEVCPFSASRNEDHIAQDLYSEGSYFDKRVGFYRKVFAGYVTENGFRSKGSSGGLVTWVLSELLRLHLIDGVIHVAKTGDPSELFEYVISYTVDDVKANSKSRYYPVHFDKIIDEVRESKKVFAFVGVPCFVKAMRLLMEQDAEIRGKIKFCIAIFCGHLKSKAFSEMIGWQQKIIPAKLSAIDFRVKNNSRPASQYSVQVSERINSEESLEYEPVYIGELYGMDWGMGFFRPKACDWCDDIAGETADLSCGDAWLPEFSSESGGTNIVVVRNSQILETLMQGMDSSNLHLITQSVDNVYDSQAGNYRHRQEGLSLRILSTEKEGLWQPKKRITTETFEIPPYRQRIYNLRSHISAMSHEKFLQAKHRNSFLFFIFKMIPAELHYAYLNKRLIKAFLKTSYHLMKYLQRVNNK